MSEASTARRKFIHVAHQILWFAVALAIAVLLWLRLGVPRWQTVQCVAPEGGGTQITCLVYDTVGGELHGHVLTRDGRQARFLLGSPVEVKP